MVGTSLISSMLHPLGVPVWSSGLACCLNTLSEVVVPPQADHRGLMYFTNHNIAVSQASILKMSDKTG